MSSIWHLRVCNEKQQHPWILNLNNHICMIVFMCICNFVLLPRTYPIIEVIQALWIMSKHQYTFKNTNIERLKPSIKITEIRNHNSKSFLTSIFKFSIKSLNITTIKMINIVYLDKYGGVPLSVRIMRCKIDWSWECPQKMILRQHQMCQIDILIILAFTKMFVLF